MSPLPDIYSLPVLTLGESLMLCPTLLAAAVAVAVSRKSLMDCADRLGRLRFLILNAAVDERY